MSAPSSADSTDSAFSENPRPRGAPIDLDGRVAIVTGGSRGIGRALAFGLADAGSTVVIASRKLDACEAVAREITDATGQRAVACATHVGRWEDCDRLAAFVYDELGRCDVLVNNAGMSPIYDGLASVTEELYDKVHAVNARGAFRLSSLIGTRMAEGDGGSIINISTAGSWRPNATDLPYAMAKAALNAMTMGMAEAWAPKVRVNTVLPGPYETGAVTGWGPEAHAAIATMNPMGRIGQPEDLIGLVTFLASDASAYINGAQVLADGGMFRSL